MPKNVLIALGLLVLGGVFGALYDVSIKWLPQQSDAAMFLLLRQSSAVVMMLPLWFYAGCPKTQHIKLHTLRANSGAVSSLLLIISLLTLPLATVSSLFYSAPLMIVVMGMIVLHERVTLVQLVTTSLGFIGILIILRPSEISLAGVIVLAAAIIFASNQLSLRKLSTEEAASTTVLLYNLLSLPLVIMIVAFQGVTDVSWQLFAIALLSNGFLIAYQLFCVLAYRKAQASEIAVAEYSGLLFCILFGWLLFDEWLDNLTLIGAALVVLPSLLLPKLKSVLDRRKLMVG